MMKVTLVRQMKPSLLSVLSVLFLLMLSGCLEKGSRAREAQNGESAVTPLPTSTPTPTLTPVPVPPSLPISTATPKPSSTPTPTPTPAPAPTTGQAYYVSPTGSDSNSGSSTAPWRTIGKAAETMVAGDTTLVMNGTYTEASINFKNSGTSIKPITLRAQNKWGAILSSTSSCNPNFSVYASYITIEDMRVAISPSNVYCAPNSASGAAVRCWSSITPTSASASTGWVGCTVRGMKVDPSTQRSVGLKSNQDYTLFEGNEVHSSIEAFNNFGSIFRNNYVDTGDVWGDLMYGKGGVRNLQMYNNVIDMRNGGGRGLFVGGNSSCCWWESAGHYEAFNSVAYNNVVIGQPGAAALGLAGAYNSALFNNVVVNGGQLFFGVGGDTSTPPQPYPYNPTVKNNIFMCGGGSATSGFNYTGTLSLDYNDFYQCTSAPAQSHNIVGNPLFVNPLSDWHLMSGSPASGTGVQIFFTGYTGTAIDMSQNKDGNIRTLPWNLGLY